MKVLGFFYFFYLWVLLREDHLHLQVPAYDTK